MDGMIDLNLLVMNPFEFRKSVHKRHSYLRVNMAISDQNAESNFIVIQLTADRPGCTKTN